VPVRLLTDEHISPEVAHQLTNAGFDVICARDRGLLGWDDWDLMRKPLNAIPRPNVDAYLDCR
jgi:hypothetical protein